MVFAVEIRKGKNPTQILLKLFSISENAMQRL